jgi:hypothetical protein
MMFPIVERIGRIRGNLRGAFGSEIKRLGEGFRPRSLKP